MYRHRNFGEGYEFNQNLGGLQVNKDPNYSLLVRTEQGEEVGGLVN